MSSLPWTDPPVDPMPYRLRTRLRDVAAGWWDGRRGVPERVEDDLQITTPKLDALRADTLKAIAEEHESLEKAIAPLRRLVASARTTQDVLPYSIELAKKLADQAWPEPTEIELESRRLAELDHRLRPDDLVRRRRQGDYQRRVLAAEAQVIERNREFATAVRNEIALLEVIAHRTAVAQAAARRIHHHGERRIATYLQRLVRRHKQGLWLNTHLTRHPAGPELPAWVTNVSEE